MQTRARALRSRVTNHENWRERQGGCNEGEVKPVNVDLREIPWTQKIPKHIPLNVLYVVPGLHEDDRRVWRLESHCKKGLFFCERDKNDSRLRRHVL